MAARRKSREMALQIIFQREFEKSLSWEDALDRFSGSFETPSVEADFVKKIVRGVWTHLDEIDSKISSHSNNWKIDRLAFVDRNILRISAFELMYLGSEVPPKVVIDEAIEISKKFGSQDSSAFVNGVLDSLSKSIR